MIELTEDQQIMHKELLGQMAKLSDDTLNAYALRAYRRCACKVAEKLHRSLYDAGTPPALRVRPVRGHDYYDRETALKGLLEWIENPTPLLSGQEYLEHNLICQKMWRVIEVLNLSVGRFPNKRSQEESFRASEEALKFMHELNRFCEVDPESRGDDPKTLRLHALYDRCKDQIERSAVSVQTVLELKEEHSRRSTAPGRVHPKW